MALSVEEEIIDTSKKLPETEEFSEEQFMVGDDSQTMFNSEPKLGEAFEIMSGDTFEQTENRNERLVSDLKKENDKLKVELGAALNSITPGGDDGSGKGNGKEKGAFSKFIQDVGSNLSAIARVVPEKIEEISKDPKKKKNFIRGLEIINASSGIRPIGQAKSPLGAISEGLLKAEKGFIAKDLAEAKNANERLKALKSGRNVLDPQEKALLDSYTKYSEKEAANRKNYAATFDIYNLLKKAAVEGKQLPTGKLNQIFQGTEQIVSEIPGGEALLKKLYDTKGDPSSMSPKERITFKNMLGAATKQKIVAQVKELYPVSNKDIEILLQTVGDVGTNPEALRRLVAAQMASRDIALNQRKYATNLFKKNDLDFVENSFYDSEKELADKFREGVSPDILIEMYGTTEDITDSGIIAAHYYQTLQPQFKDGKNPFEIFTEKRDIDQEDLIDSIRNFQNKLSETSAPE
jgi:hypothetical protein